MYATSLLGKTRALALGAACLAVTVEAQAVDYYNGSQLSIPLVSYNGMLEFGLVADADAVPDLDELGRDIDAAVAELLQAARRQKLGGRARNSRPTGAHV